jgi:ornithine cyclodeaminase
VRVWSRNPGHAAAFAVAEAKRTGLRIEAAPTAETAVRGADLICTTTSAKEPVLFGEWLAPGTHINAVGACFRNAREIDGAAMKRARVFTDCRESAENEAGDLLIAIDEGVIGKDHLLGEIGQVLNGTIAGRRSPDEITLYESLGVAVEDLAAAHHLLQRAHETHAGVRVPWDA